MKFTKKHFKRFSALVGAVSLSFAFGIGYLIANNEKIDYTPVISVPVVKPDMSITYNNGNPVQIDLSTALIVDFTETHTGNYSNSIIDLTFTYDNNCSSILTLGYNLVSPLVTDDFFTADLSFNYSSFYTNEEYTPDLKIYYHLYAYEGDGVDCIDIYAEDIFYRTYQSTTSYFESGNVDITFYVIVPFDLIQYVFNSDSIYSNGFNDGQNFVLTHLEDYDLFTQTEYLEYGQEQYYLGLGASGNVLSLGEFAREIFRAPISMFKNAFNFVLPLPDGTTLNVGGILTFFLTIGIALTIVNLIMKIGGH